MPEKECLKSENCVYFYLTTANHSFISHFGNERPENRSHGLINSPKPQFY